MYYGWCIGYVNEFIPFFGFIGNEFVYLYCAGLTNLVNMHLYRFIMEIIKIYFFWGWRFGLNTSNAAMIGNESQTLFWTIICELD
jgi:hypothetical protein